MEANNRKKLIEDYKYRKPDIGVFSIRSKATGETFIGRSKDVPAEFNSLRFKLSSRMHPNKRLQAIWDQFGEHDLELSVVCLLKYEDPQDDHTQELEALFEKCLAECPEAGRVWK